MKIGNRLALAREDRKINQSEMADLLSITVPTYSRLERNETSIDLDQVVRFANIMEIPIQDFLPETITQNNTHNQNTQGGMGGNILGNIYNYFSDKDLASENQSLKEKNTLLEGKIKDLEEIIRLLKRDTLL